MWPAEWRVFLYSGGGLPSEAIRRGRRSMRCGSATLGGFGIGEGVEGGEDAFVHLLDFVILSALVGSIFSLGDFFKRDRRPG